MCFFWLTSLFSYFFFIFLWNFSQFNENFNIILTLSSIIFSQYINNFRNIFFLDNWWFKHISLYLCRKFVTFFFSKKNILNVFENNIENLIIVINARLVSKTSREILEIFILFAKNNSSDENKNVKADSNEAKINADI